MMANPNQVAAYQAYKNKQNEELAHFMNLQSMEGVAKQTFLKERQADKLRNSKSAWFYPGYEEAKDERTGKVLKPRTIYIGETEDRARPTWEVPIVNGQALADIITENKSGQAASASMDKKRDNFISPWATEFAEDAYNWYTAASAGMMTTADFPVMQLVTTFTDILNVEQRVFTLDQAVTQKQTNVLKIMVAEYNRFGITEEIGELETPDTRKGNFSTTTFTLGKAGGHVAWSDEFSMVNWIDDPQRYATQNMASDIVRVKVKKIAAILATASVTTGGSSWNAYKATGAVDTSNVNPLLQVLTAAKEIDGNYGVANVLACSQLTYNAYLGNTYVLPLISTPQDISPLVGTVNGPKGMPDYTLYIDRSIADGIMYVYSRDAVWFVQGPARTSTYRDELPGAQGVLFRDWHKAVVRKAGWLRQLTALTP